MGVIVVTGIPGVGKTTVMKKATVGMDIEFVTFGTVMIDIAIKMGLVKDRDEMRKLTLEQQKDLQIKFEELSSSGLFSSSSAFHNRQTHALTHTRTLHPRLSCIRKYRIHSSRPSLAYLSFFSERAF